MGNKVIIDDSIIGQRWAKAKDVNLADKLLHMKEDNQTDVWKVIDAIVDSWKSRNYKEWQSHLIDVGRLSDTRADEFGSNRKTKKSASITDMRYLADIPQWIILVLRKLYSVDELPMNKKFFREFARRYPVFRVAKKI
jgi:hypothetical protein